MGIQIYQDRVVPTTQSPVNQATGYEITAGLSNLSKGLSNAADTLYKQDQAEQKLTDNANYHGAYRDFINTQDTLQTQALSDPDIDNVEQKYIGNLRKSQTQFAEKIADPQLRQNFYTQTEGLMLSGGKQIRSHTLKQKNDLAIGGLDDAITNITNKAVATTDPNDQQAYFGVLQSQIDSALENGILTPAQAQNKKRSILTTFDRSNVVNLINNNPKQAVEALSGEGFLHISPNERINFRQQALSKLADNIQATALMGVYENQPTPENVSNSGTPVKKQSTKRNIQNIPIDFETSVDYLIDRWEGGYVAKDGASNAPANLGINQKYNPDVDVANLTRSQAEKKHRETWDAIDADNLPPQIRYIAFDLATNSGADAEVKAMIKQAGNDPQKLIELRKEKYARLAKDPKHAGSVKGWNNRINEIEDLSNNSNINQNTDTGANTAIVSDNSTTDNDDDPTDLSLDGMGLLPPQMQMQIKQKIMLERDKLNKERQTRFTQIAKISMDNLKDYNVVELSNSTDPQVQQDLAILQTAAENGDIASIKKLQKLQQEEYLHRLKDSYKGGTPFQINDGINQLTDAYDANPNPFIREQIKTLTEYKTHVKSQLKSDRVQYAIDSNILDGEIRADSDVPFGEQLQRRTMSLPSFYANQDITPEFFTSYEKFYFKEQYAQAETTQDKLSLTKSLVDNIHDNRLFTAAMTDLKMPELASTAYYLRKNDNEQAAQIIDAYNNKNAIKQNTFDIQQNDIEGALIDYKQAFTHAGILASEYKKFENGLEPIIQVYRNQALKRGEKAFNAKSFKTVLEEFVGKPVTINGNKTMIPYDMPDDITETLDYLTNDDVKSVIGDKYSRDEFVDHARFTPYKLSDGLYTVSFGNAGKLLDPKNGKPFVLNLYELNEIAEQNKKDPQIVKNLRPNFIRQYKNTPDTEIAIMPRG